MNTKKGLRGHGSDFLKVVKRANKNSKNKRMMNISE
jgi:hypothetical protein